MDALKKTINRAKQAVDEKFAGAERTQLDPALQKQLEKLDDVRKYTSTIVAAVEAYVQPDPTLRILPGMIQESANKPETLSIEAGQLGNRLGHDDKFGQGLKYTSEAFNKLGQAEREFLDNVHKKYTDVVRKVLNEDFKGLESEKAKLNGARLDLDSAKNKFKGKEPTPEDDGYRQALEAYHTQVAKVNEVAAAVDAKLPELHAALKALVDVDIDYASQKLQVLKDLQKGIN